jgi:hypothetical protein
MPSPVTGESPVESARIDDLDLDCDEEVEEWERRLAAVASTRLAEARARLDRLGVFDENGNLVSTALPPDMRPGSTPANAGR